MTMTTTGNELNNTQTESLVPISEVFGIVIQGEGSLAGTPTVFVRVGGCDYRCTWCDTMYAVDKKKYGDTWTKMSCSEILSSITILTKGQPILVTLSGGNPALFELGRLITEGRKQGYSFACETQGSIYKDWFEDLSNLTLSPKPPSSGETTDWDKLDRCVETKGWKILDSLGKVYQFISTLKVVVNDEDDYQYAKQVHERYSWVPFYISVCSETSGTTPFIRAKIADKYNEILSWLIRDQWYDCRLGFQQHTMIYGNQRGV